MKCQGHLGYSEGYDENGIPKGFEIRCENEVTTQRREDKVFMDFSIPTLVKKRFTYNLCADCAEKFDNKEHPSQLTNNECGQITETGTRK